MHLIRVFKLSKIILKYLFFFILKLLQKQLHNYPSSENDKEILYFFFLIFFQQFFCFINNLINGLPFFSFNIIISLKLIPFEIPVPSAFEKASFAANLLAKQFNEFFVFLHFFISF